jgi:ABC-type transport system involved in cytochrome c biogenesis permease component
MNDRPSVLRGLARHFVLTLQLNFRSTQALIYGYLVPVFFLLAFGSVFRDDTPLLYHQMGQLLAISILGGACFGLPTALVAERERGVWRRYRLLPVRTSRLVLGTLTARLIIIALAAALQIVLARVIYGTPFPLHPLQTVVAFLFVTVSFLGLGLLVAALANDVPAVQALGQCLFLPMIMIGGVGVPLAVLPVWAQRVAGFMPGRYAVDVLQRGVSEAGGLAGAGFSLLALGVIGAAAGMVGAKLFRWDNSRRLGGPSRAGIALALGAWIAVGAGAAWTGHLKPVLPEAALWQSITDDEIASITYQDLPGDHEFVTPLAPPFHGPMGDRSLDAFAERLRRWPPGRLDNAGQSIRNLVCVAAIADLIHDPHEAAVARIVFDQLQARFDPNDLRHALAWIIMFPDDGRVVDNVPELGFGRHPPDVSVRSRSALYARKFLGRILGIIHEER